MTDAEKYNAGYKLRDGKRRYWVSPRSIAKAEKKASELMKATRQIKLPPHPFNKILCCGDCLRHYYKMAMRRHRDKAREART